MMCLIRAFSNIIVIIATFLLVYIPKSLLGFSLFPDFLESFLICVGLNCYLFNEFQSVYVSINRFIAIYIPNHYSLLCGNWTTGIVNFLLILDRMQNVVFETYHRTIERKWISFSPDSLMFTALEVEPTGLVLKFGLVFFIAFVANAFTFIKICIFYLKHSYQSDAGNWRLISKNMKLFTQTVFQDSLFVVDTFFTYNMSSLIEHRFWYFICATFIWQTIHVIDGFVMIMFNDRLSLLKNALFGSTSVSETEGRSENRQPGQQRNKVIVIN